MSRRSYQQVSIFVLALLALAGMIVSGCSRSPLESGTTAQPTVLKRAAAASASLTPGSELFTEAVIASAAGGQLQLLDVTLTVPAGAVPNDTTFSIRIPDINSFYNEFGADGLVFAEPVTVSMSYRDADLSGVSEEHIRIAWQNPKTGAFESMACSVDTVNKTVTGKLYHFSAYALISD
jgi:hypothetical protein